MPNDRVNFGGSAMANEWDAAGDACFTYGSLMCADILARVTGRQLTGEPARLAGYRRHPVTGEDYPGLIEDPMGVLDGQLYRGLDATAWRRLDAFEGEMYERCALWVNPVGGEPCPAWCYIFRQEYRHLLGPGDWDFARFLTEGKATFEARYVGFVMLD